MSEVAIDDDDLVLVISSRSAGSVTREKSEHENNATSVNIATVPNISLLLMLNKSFYSGQNHNIAAKPKEAMETVYAWFRLCSEAVV